MAADASTSTRSDTQAERRPSPSPADAPVVQLVDVGVAWSVGDEEHSILHDVNLTIPTGEFCALMGPSGSGKSTILNLISGLLPPSQGRVLFDNRDLYALSDHDRTTTRREAVGFVFQFFNLVPALTVLENVALPLIIAGIDPATRRDELEDLLVRVGLHHRAGHHPAQLSGGELQRVTIARALVNRPRLILADEPTGNVSQKMAREIMDLLRQTHEELDQTILLVTHNHRDAARADRVLFLKDGTIADRVLRGEDVDATHILSVLQELDI
jgi:putative ABC transport system ATP-binding protein